MTRLMKKRINIFSIFNIILIYDAAFLDLLNYSTIQNSENLTILSSASFSLGLIFYQLFLLHHPLKQPLSLPIYSLLPTWSPILVILPTSLPSSIRSLLYIDGVKLPPAL